MSRRAAWAGEPEPEPGAQGQRGRPGSGPSAPGLGFRGRRPTSPPHGLRCHPNGPSKCPVRVIFLSRPREARPPPRAGGPAAAALPNAGPLGRRGSLSAVLFPLMCRFSSDLGGFPALLLPLVRRPPMSRGRAPVSSFGLMYKRSCGAAGLRAFARAAALASWSSLFGSNKLS